MRGNGPPVPPDTEPGPARVKALFISCLTLITLGDLDGIEARTAECLAQAEHFGVAEAAAATASAILAATLRGGPAQVVSLSEVLLATHRAEEPLTFPTMVALVSTGHAYVAAGRIAKAIGRLEEHGATCDRHGERCQRAWGDLLRAQAELARGRPRAAQEYARAALAVKYRLHDSVGYGMCLDVLAQAAATDGQVEHAAHLLGLAQQVWDTLGRPQTGIPAWTAAREACEQHTRQALGGHAYRLAFHTGYETDLDTGIARTLGTPGSDSSG
ncbi:hypothetical protein [Streptomyces sclerotialus]|uniref:hypothetical protein n=1 Tax=Streptomyces sclerotialus TaxID=1957 RepID=UPI0018CBEC3A